MTADDAFAAAFTAYAASYSPVRIVRFDGRRRSGLIAVTRRFAAQVRSDLARIRRLIRSQRGRDHADLRGLVAAEIADLYLLGRSATAVRTLDAHVRRGDVDGGGAPHWAGPSGATSCASCAGRLPLSLGSADRRIQAGGHAGSRPTRGAAAHAAVRRLVRDP